MADSTLPEKPVMSESNEERTLPESFKSPLPEETPEESKATVTAAPSEIGFSAGMDGLHETIQDDVTLSYQDVHIKQALTRN